MPQTRRTFLTRAALAGAALIGPWPARTFATATRDANSRPIVGMIGCGGIAQSHGRALRPLADIAAVCDIDRAHLDRYHAEFTAGKARAFPDYRQLLELREIDAVFISTPDHWHTRIALDAMRAGKDVYCEKPLTLTIDEGRRLLRVAKETGRVFQVGTQQRSDRRFQTAVALVQSGRIGKARRATIALGAGRSGGPFPKSEPPAGLDWDGWLGQAPKVPYIAERGHRSFRWWYEYSGGKLTDWGAHHVDIAQWALAPELPGPATIEVLRGEHPQSLKSGMPTRDDCFNTATTFAVRCTFANGAEMLICDEAKEHGFDNGILFEGEGGSFFVNRQKLTGAPADELKTNPLPEEALAKLRRGRAAMNHHENFFASCRDRAEPISDLASHHRHLTTCHLANIALRLGRALKWDGAREQILNDAEADAMQRREQRKGFETA